MKVHYSVQYRLQGNTSYTSGGGEFDTELDARREAGKLATRADVSRVRILVCVEIDNIPGGAPPSS